MRRGVALCTHLWRNDVACEETLVVADAQEDQGFDRAAAVTAFVYRDGREGGFKDGDGDGDGGWYGDGIGDRFGSGIKNGSGDGGENGAGIGNRDGSGYGQNTTFYWTSGTPYPFLDDEAQDAPCEPE